MFLPLTYLWAVANGVFDCSPIYLQIRPEFDNPIRFPWVQIITPSVL